MDASDFDARGSALEVDAEYEAEVKQAHDRYGERLKAADALMAKVTPKQFAERLIAGQDVIPATTASQELAQQERDLSLKLAAVRLVLRQNGPSR